MSEDDYITVQNLEKVRTALVILSGLSPQDSALYPTERKDLIKKLREWEERLEFHLPEIEETE